jgi:hypothetical protein
VLPLNIAYFITPHGFGHAARAAAVMEALQVQLPHVHFDVFTTCPQRFFSTLPKGMLNYHCLATDLGMVQLSPLRTDVTATCLALDQMLPFEDHLVQDLAGRLSRMDCRLVICDIAAMGIAAARKAGLPTILVENFTWDWIYQAYLPHEPGFKRHIKYLSNVYAQADLHIQTNPLCRELPGKPLVGPISRRPRRRRDEVRRELNIPDGAGLVLVSMGGIPDAFDFLQKIPATMTDYLVIPGADNQKMVHPRVRLLPTHSTFFHPDLMAAADALVAKAGYSTVAEAYYEGIPYGCISRADSPESRFLADFVQRYLPCLPITAEEYTSGDWIRKLPSLTGLPRTPHHEENGADAAADLIRSLLSRAL